MLTGPGPTVIGRFASVEEARRCVIYLRQAGFEEDEVGFNAPAEGPAMVSVLAGDRWAEARLILARPERRRAAPARRSVIREAVERVLRRGLRIEPVGKVAQDRGHPRRES